MSQKYFITGASGGLGIELVKAVLSAGHTVVAAVSRAEALADMAGHQAALEEKNELALAEQEGAEV